MIKTPTFTLKLMKHYQNKKGVTLTKMFYAKFYTDYFDTWAVKICFMNHHHHETLYVLRGSDYMPMLQKKRYWLAHTSNTNSNTN